MIFRKSILYSPFILSSVTIYIHLSPMNAFGTFDFLPSCLLSFSSVSPILLSIRSQFHQHFIAYFARFLCVTSQNTVTGWNFTIIKNLKHMVNLSAFFATCLCVRKRHLKGETDLRTTLKARCQGLQHKRNFSWMQEKSVLAKLKNFSNLFLAKSWLSFWLLYFSNKWNEKWSLNVSYYVCF